jgi:DNA polymerase I
MSTDSPSSQRELTERWLLVDGSSYLYRAFHALPDLRGPQGEPTGAMHGMVNMLRRLREQYPDTTHAVCVFDAKGPNFRNDWYPAYKAQRPPMPDDLRLQVEPIHEVVRLLGWPILEVPGIEADDAIGTMAVLVAAQGQQVVISTGDKDMAQLVNPQVTLVNTMSNETLDEAGVQAKFGVAANRIIDYLSLMGDTVDNVPGVEKVGPKTAAKWIQEHGSLEGVMAASASIKGVVGDNLRKALDWLPQAYRLVTIKTDCDLSTHIATWPSLDALTLREPDWAGLLAYCRQYGFKTWQRELEKQLGAAPVSPKTPASTGDLFADAPSQAPVELPLAVPVPDADQLRYTTILTWEAFDRLLDQIMGAELVAFDTETDSLEPMHARVVGLSFSTRVGQADYIPLTHAGPDAPEQLPLDEVLDRLRPWLEDPLRPKVGQNIKYDLHVMANMGVQVRGYVHDTLLQSYVLEAHKPHSLESLALRHLSRKGLSYEEVAGKGAQQIPFAQVPVDTASRYSCEDSDMTLHVHQILWPQVQAHAQLLDVYQRMEMPVAHVLQRIERHGVLIDKALLVQQSHELGERMLALEQAAHASAGQPFNLGSPKQIGDILFGQQGLPVVKKTATGAPSTDEEVLEKLAQDYPLPAMILEHRSLAKLKSTYCDKLPLMIHPQTGRVHTNYAQAVAVTGRLSSNDPNLQNIPVRTAEGRRIREAFIAPPGHVLVSADYSQIELRIMAHLSEDEGLLAAFAQGQDVHRATASEVFGVSVDQVSAEQRRYAKVINFGLIYGMSSFGLASNLGIERSAATSYIERYFQRYPGVKRYMDNTRVQARDQGYVETVFGRRLWLPEINSPNGPRRAGAERAAINAPMQGTAADLIKFAMAAVQEALDQQGKASRMIMQVHDELVLEVPEHELDWARLEIPRLMAGVASLRVPLLAEVGHGPNWEAAH